MQPERPDNLAELGLMQGSPAPADKRVTWSNWMDGPFNRWAFLHVREVVRTALVSRGEGPVFQLSRQGRDLEAFTFRHRGQDVTLRQMMDATYVDGLMVVHDGSIAYEWYVEGMGPETTHLCMSVSKSLTATLTGVLVGDGRFDLDATVPDYVNELAGTSWAGCNMRHLLDMRAGTRFDESDYEDRESEVYKCSGPMGWLPPQPGDIAADSYGYIPQLVNQSEHGGPFEYRSILTDVLGWCMERATGERLADLYSREIWSKIGAAHDADLMVDSAGFANADGGFNVTLQDLARFGLMHLQGGEIDGRRIVLESWIERLLVPNGELVEAFEGAPEHHDFPEGAFYHDQWWVLDAKRGIYSGYGIHGQQVLIHRPSNTVVARFSTWPRPWIDELSELADAGLLALCESL